MKKYAFLFSIVVLSLSCDSNNSGTGTRGTATGNTGYPWSGPLLIAIFNSSSSTAVAEIATSSGPVTNAAVTMSYSGGSVPLSYVYGTSASVTYNGAVTTIGVAYYDTTSFSYVANQPYTIAANINGTSYSAYTTSVGTPVFSTSGSNLVCTWTGGGNENVIVAYDTVGHTTKTFGPNVTSPYSIANSSLPGSSGHNSVTADIMNLNTSAFTGTSNGSYLLATSSATTTY